jgi:hypothetical protein
MMRLLVVAVIALTLVACDMDDDARDAPTATPAAVESPTAVAERSPPAVDARRQTIAGCPVDDAALCQFALDLRDAVASANLAPIEARLIAEERPCAGTFTLADGDIGCDSEGDTSEPVVAYFHYGSDCCYVPPGQFAQLLLVALGQPVDDTWRIWGILEGSQFWDGAPSVLLIRGAPDDRQVIEFGATGSDDSIGIAGLIRGTVMSLYIFPDAQLKAWR